MPALLRNRRAPGDARSCENTAVGIHIHYKGNLDDPSRRDEALDDIREFCRTAGWKWKDWSEHYSGVMIVTQEQADGDVPSHNEPWPEDLEPVELGCVTIRARVSTLHPPPLIDETCLGVLVEPPGTDVLRLTFNSAGRLFQCWPLPRHIIAGAIPDTEHYMAFEHSIGTTGQAETHASICSLFDRLKKSFMSNLAIRDTSRFWETRDMQQLRSQQSMMASAFGLFQNPSTMMTLLKVIGRPVAEGTKITPARVGVPEPAEKKKEPEKPS